jgi:hypothetical protein
MTVLLALYAQATTSTTEEEIPRVVGEHPGSWVVIAAGAVLLVAILVGGFVVNRRLTAGNRAG